jgi:Tfp pilus assembly PilM family ATPase
MVKHPPRVPYTAHVPRMLLFSGVGLDITDRRVRVLELQLKERNTRVEKYGEMPVPPGVIVGGAIKQPLEFSTVLQSLSLSHDISSAQVSLPEEHAYIVHMDIPHVEDDEIREVIMAQLVEFGP